MKLLAYGSLNIDHVYRVEHIVEAGETISVSDYFQNPGGKGLNLSIALSRAGSDIFHAGIIGEDGGFLVDTLEDNHVDCSYVSRIKGVSGQAIIQVSDVGENSILVNGGTNLKQSRTGIDSVLSHFETGDMVILQNEINNIDYIINKAHEKGMEVVLNPSPFNDIIKSLDLTKVSYLVVNEIEGKTLSGCEGAFDIVNTLLKQYHHLKVVLTLGSKGALYADKEDQIKVDSYKAKVVDTTAAGDTFLGYFISQISRGIKVHTALNIASKAASLTVSKEGASKSIPLMEEVR